jgi:hypothetical protein
MNGATMPNDRKSLKAAQQEAEWQMFLKEFEETATRMNVLLTDHFEDWEYRCSKLDSQEKAALVRDLAAKLLAWSKAAKCARSFDPMNVSDTVPEYWYVGSFYRTGWLLGRIHDPDHLHFKELVLMPKGKLVVWIGGSFFRRKAKDPDSMLGSFVTELPLRISAIVANYPDVPWKL